MRHASVGSEASITFGQDGVLQVTGTIVTNIECSDPFLKGEMGPGIVAGKMVMKGIQRIIKKMNLQRLAAEDSRKLRALCQVLCSNEFQDSEFPTREDPPSLQESEIFLRRIITSPSENVGNILSFTENNRPYLTNVRAICFGRSLFQCVDGRIGVGPKDMRSGDIVTVWLGCNSSMILRPLQNGRYQVVGEAFCEGVVTGEALLGTLPDHVDLVRREDEEFGGCYFSHFNRDEGTFHVKDPRLGELLHGWRTESHSHEGYFSVFFNSETGETTGDDPRLTVEALTSRGVELQVFDLI